MKKTLCDKCNHEIGNHSFKKHYNSCNGKGPGFKIQFCPKCNKSREEIGLGKGKLGAHIKWCGFDKSTYSVERLEKMKQHALEMTRNRKYFNQFDKARKLNLDIPEHSLKGKPGIKGRKATDETRKKISEGQKLAIANGKIIKAGRCKKYTHISPIAGEISVDGTWELRFCIWADKNGLIYERNKKGFKYLNLTEKEATYYPDFQLNDSVFVEIKGYETELDRCKWKQFPYKLIIIKKEEIENLSINMFL